MLYPLTSEKAFPMHCPYYYVVIIKTIAFYSFHMSEFGQCALFGDTLVHRFLVHFGSWTILIVWGKLWTYFLRKKNAHAKWHSSLCINFRDLGTFFTLKALAVLLAIYVIYTGRTDASSPTLSSGNDSKWTVEIARTGRKVKVCFWSLQNLLLLFIRLIFLVFQYHSFILTIL